MTGPVWVVIPAYHEEKVVGQVVAAVRSRHPDVVVVDDGSRDGTAAAARAAGAVVLRHLVNRGQGAALKTGIDFALAQGAAAVVTFDSDGQHRPEDIDALLAPVLNGACDVALGSRFLASGGDIPWTRKTISPGKALLRAVPPSPTPKWCAPSLRQTQDRP